MMYLFDANTLIRSARDDFPMDREPAFWEWLDQLFQRDEMKIPECICEELLRYDDKLSAWVGEKRDLLQRLDAPAFAYWTRVLEAYRNPTAKDLERIQNDSLLVAHALSLNGDGTVVTYEKYKDSPVSGNIGIPTVCQRLRIPCMTLPRFLWERLQNTVQSYPGRLELPS